LNGLLLDSTHSGTATYTRNLLAHLPVVAPDLSFRLFVRQAEAPRARMPVERLTSPFARLNHGTGAGARLDKLAWETVSLPLAASLRRESLIHSLYFAAPVLKPVPVVVTVHDLIPLIQEQYHRGPAPILYSRLMAYAVRSAVAIITVSEHSRRDIVRLLHVPTDRVHVTPEAAGDGFSPEATNGEAMSLRERYRLPARYLLYLGGCERRKNLETLIRAWSRVERRMADREVSLVVVARFPRPDLLFPDIPGLARELGTKRVCFLPYVDETDKPALYRQAVGFCFPSRYEGFGLPPLEAMASGTPTLVSNASSLPEVVGQAARMLDPTDVDAWAGAMLDLVDDEGAREDLAHRGLQRAAEFSWEQTARRTAAVYRSVLGR
jgi:glycosyltransferase involved in cell wall biosynthesis